MLPLIQPESPLPQICSTAELHAVYIHIPFCFHKCHYCDFYSIVDRPNVHNDRQEVFTEHLKDELQYMSDHFDVRPQTLFIGGGTPTLLQPVLWDRLLAKLRKLGMLDRVKEFTVEANPETVTQDLMARLVAGGVNRISMGCQSFDLSMLKMLERQHDPARVPKAFETVQTAGIDQINLDLIFAIPGQTLGMVESDLQTALKLEPQHLSIYGLTYEPGTPLAQRRHQGQFTPVDEETERRMYGLVINQMAGAGFEHYEVSNWAKWKSDWKSNRPEKHGASVRIEQGASAASRRCQHNMIYWTNGNWLGLGPSAASHIEGHRWKNEPHLGRYMADVPPPTIDHEILSPERRVGEAIMLGLRMREGIELDWLNENLLDTDQRNAAIQEMVDMDLLERNEGRLQLTRNGLFVADSVIARLL